MGDDQAPEHRVINQTIKELIGHIRRKMDLLPNLALRFNLSDEVVREIRRNLQSEIEDLHSLPEDATL